MQCKGRKIKTIQSIPKIKAKMHPPKKSPVKKNKNKNKTKKKMEKTQQQTEVCNNFSLP